MTTMSSTDPTGTRPGPPPPRPLRRSAGNRVLSGVAGGLGEYFGVDPVLFRVLFAVLSVFGGVGLLVYGLAWVLIPEPDVDVSLLDRGFDTLRKHRVPPWLVVGGGAFAVWLLWFSWWAPGALPGVLLVAAVTLVLLNRLSKRGAASAQTRTDSEPGTLLMPYPEPSTELEPFTAAPADHDPGQLWSAPPAQTAPLIAPLSDPRRPMQAWLAEAGEAHRKRVRRRRPIKIAVGLALLAGWGLVAMLDGFRGVPFPVYLWVGLGVLGAGLLASVATRRMMLSLLAPILALGIFALVLGGTTASLADGSGRVGWVPTSPEQLTDHRQFAGRSTLDLTKLTALTSPDEVRITQAAGEVLVRIPARQNVTVIADVHLGDIRGGQSSAAGDYQAGSNVHLRLDPPAGSGGQPVTVRVRLTVGHVQVDRVG